MARPRGIGALILATIAALVCSQASFADEEAPAAPGPFFKAEDVFAGQRPAQNDPFAALMWANAPWQPFAAPFGGFNLGQAGAASFGNSPASPPTMLQTPYQQYQQYQQSQYQQQAMLQQYSSWQASRNSGSSGPSRSLPGMGATSGGDPCGPGTHLSFAYAQMFIPGMRNGSGPACGQCFVAGTPVVLDSDKQIEAIESVTVGQRLRGNALSIGMSIDPTAWRRVELRASKRDGTEATLVLLRPLSWLKQHDVTVGSYAPIAAPECGIDGLAEVLAVGPCPAIASGSGPVVTGVYRHVSSRVLDIYVEGEKEPIGTTANHQFAKGDRFVRADQLRRGDRLLGLDSNPRVTDIVERPASLPVYNLEIQGGSIYRVGSQGIAVSSVRSK